MTVSLIELEGKSFAEYYLVFRKTDRWWQILLKRDFGHVYALRWLGGCWLKIEPLLGHTEIEFYIAETEDVYSIAGSDCSAILHVKNWRSTDRYGLIFGPISCVEYMKSLLGIRGLIFTPWQLYKHLRGCNGRNIKQ